MKYKIFVDDSKFISLYESIKDIKVGEILPPIDDLGGMRLRVIERKDDFTLNDNDVNEIDININKIDALLYCEHIKD